MVPWLDRHEQWALGALMVSIVLFDVWERRRPARPLARRMELHLDLLAFCAVIAFKYSFDADAAVARWTAVAPIGLLHGLAQMPTVVKILVAISLLDFTLYWIHRGQHGLDWLWPTHVWHHTIHHLYWLSMFRVSLVHLACYAVPQAAIMLLFQMSAGEIAAASVVAVLFDFWVHSNITVNLGRLERYLVTPRYHRIHHASDRRMRKNLAFVLTLWDRLFGTYLDPRLIPDDFTLGLDEPRTPTGTMRMVIGV
jgi:sterol desaturase/sphingolipid hydroxylase (fatty acid hydroxylase superfamily)